MSGRFVLVLHSHLPYVLGKGRWPFGEEWLHEIVLDTYLPLLEELQALDRDGVTGSIAIGLTPILMEQLKSPVYAPSFRAWTSTKQAELVLDASRLGDASSEAMTLNAYYRKELERRIQQFDAIDGDIVAAFGELQAHGRISVLTSCATHGYLPLFSNDESRRLQIRAGVTTYEHWMGRKPTGFWLPECGYLPGVERLLSESGLRYFFADASALDTTTHELPSGYALLPTNEDAPWTPWNIGSGVAAFLRNPATSEQVWSRDRGYPGDGVYREFHRRAEGSGWQYWRITDKHMDMGEKQWYEPEAGKARAREHARHFVGLVQDLCMQHEAATGDPGIVVAAYDTELFGHWWYEGPGWVSWVMRDLAAGGSVSACVPETVLQERTLPAGRLRESSWGAGGGHETWMNSETSWIWDVIHEDQRRFIRLVPSLSGDLGDMLLREILLEESSDWPFLITTGQARSYGMSRFLEHHRKVRALLAAAEGQPYNAVESDEQPDAVFGHLHLQNLRRPACQN